VRLLIALAGAAVLALLAAPEIPRYGAERRVGVATAAFQDLVASPQIPDTQHRIQAVGLLALSTTTALPGDPRPWMIGASSLLVTGQPQRALEFYRAALATGERSEIDLNLGRSYLAIGKREPGEAALLRAGWISPEILASLPEAPRGPLQAQIARLDAELRQGTLAAPPPLPSDEPR
jgi:hypothetical protein